VRELTEGVEQTLVVDPDSRLTQLGLLPLTSEVAGRTSAHGTDYLFFPSREYRHDSTASLSELTSAWLDEVLAPAQPVRPSLSLKPADLEASRSLTRRIRRERQPIITVNFGVGGNQSKRVSDDFEKELVNTLLQEGAVVVLDKGAGADEARGAEAVIEFATRSSNDRLRVIELDEESMARLPGGDRIEAQLVVWSGRIGVLAALIGESDLYIGYDSAGQHIASALGVPCVDVFAGFSSRRMPDRWRPTGKSETRVVVVERSTTGREVLADTLVHARALLGQRTG
jgi:ADP-heptose:LPS heptosyltransferase